MKVLHATTAAMVWALAVGVIDAQAVDEYHYSHFNTNNGLPQNTVAAIAQTPDGYLWFATYDGLVRYDGVRFECFDKASTEGLRCNWIQSVKVDAKGDLWAGTVEGGLVRRRGNRFASFAVECGLPEANVKRVAFAPDGAPIAFFGQESLCRWNDAANRAEPMAALALEVPSVRAGNVEWRLEAGRIHRRAAGNELTFVTIAKPIDFWRSQFVDRNGSLWLASESAVERFDEAKAQRWDADKHLGGANSFAVAGEDRHGKVWLQTSRGPYRMDGDRPIAVPGPGGAAFGHVRAVFCDRDGAVWVGCNERGVFRLVPRFLTSFAPMDGILGDTVYPIFEDKSGRVAMGCRDGIVWKHKDKFEAQALIAVSMGDAAGYALAAPGDGGHRVSPRAFHQANDGTIWIGHSRGLLALRDGKLADRGAAVDGASVDVMTEADGHFWVGTHRGLFRLRAKDGTVNASTKFDENNGLPDRRVNALAVDRKNRLWVGTRAGVARLEGNSFAELAPGVIGRHRIRCIQIDERDVAWIGSFDYGLWRIEDDRVVHIDKSHGLYANGVFQILKDRRDHFWMSSNRGIYRVRRSQLDDFAAGKVRLVSCVGYGADDGMRSTECNGERQPAGIAASDGKLWFPTFGGVAVVDPELVPFNPRPPFVAVETVTVDRRAVDFKDRVVLSPGQSDLEFNFNAPGSFKAEYSQFKYRMEGLNDDWIDAGTRRMVHYSHLPPGEYVFRVAASNGDGIWNESGAAVVVEVVPHFYQTWSFAIASGLTVIGLAAAVIGLRVSDLKANAARLHQLVEEKTGALLKKTELLEAANARLEALATLDGLTNIANHRRFKEYLAAEWQRAQRTGQPLSLLLLDVDCFKLYNDRYGHQRGDDCLKRVAEVLSETANRATDLAARYGGEEFCVVLPETPDDGARQVAEVIRSRVEAMAIPHEQSKAGKFVTVSVGVSSAVPPRGNEAALAETTVSGAPNPPTSSITDPGALIASADKRLYQAKAAGRNRVA